MVNQTALGTVTIEENDKDTVIYTPSYLFRPLSNPSSLRVSLYGAEADGTMGINDGTLISFDVRASLSVNNEDAIKINTVRENLGIIRDGNKIAIERRYPLQVNDTIFYRIWNMRQRNYEFEIALTNVQLPAGTSAFLEDTYLHQKTMLSDADTTRISFDITADAGTAVQDRFRIIIKPCVVLPVTFTNIRAYELNHDINVEWTVQNELNIIKYEVEKSLDGTTFNTINSTNARGGNVTYNSLDANPALGNNYYRIKSIDNAGHIKYSRIVKVYISKGKPSIAVYPNPVTDGIINVVFSNMPSGIYHLKMYNAVGQFVFAKQITHTEGSSAEIINLDKRTAKGVYQLEITGQDGDKKVFKLITE